LEFTPVLAESYPPFANGLATPRAPRSARTPLQWCRWTCRMRCWCIQRNLIAIQH